MVTNGRMIPGVPPYGERYGSKKRVVRDKYCITVRSTHRDKKSFFKGFNGDKMLLTDDIRYAKIFEDKEATEMRNRLSEKYIEFVFGKMPK